MIRAPPKYINRIKFNVDLNSHQEVNDIVQQGILFTRIVITSYDELEMEFKEVENIEIQEQRIDNNNNLILIFAQPYKYIPQYVHGAVLYTNDRGIVVRPEW